MDSENRALRFFHTARSGRDIKSSEKSWLKSTFDVFWGMSAREYFFDNFFTSVLMVFLNTSFAVLAVDLAATIGVVAITAETVAIGAMGAAGMTGFGFAATIVFMPEDVVRWPNLYSQLLFLLAFLQVPFPWAISLVNGPAYSSPKADCKMP